MKTTWVPPSVLPALVFVFLFSLQPVASAQTTLTLNNQSQTVSTLTNTTVTMTGASELHVTAASSPLSGSVVNLNSVDAFFFLENVRPSVVTSTYLSSVKVNGAAAAVGTNARVVEYGDGTVVIPHASSFTPLQVFDGGNFTGASLSLALEVTYTDSNLGALKRTISSFKLKRGYMATFAYNTNGTGVSQIYVAQDNDIEVPLLPENLNNAAGFVRVVPWRWTGKRGWAGWSASDITNMDASWSYGWATSGASTPDVEYVPMRLSSTKSNCTTALGYNEPDSAQQDNLTVAAAITGWPNFLKSGLRLGSPAPSDSGVTGQGLQWLNGYTDSTGAWVDGFIDKAKAANLRVDYVAVHFYKGGWSAAQLSSWLKAIHERTGRPIWVTEWNNGANWTDSANPVASQSANAAVVGSFVDVMNSAPYVERYSIYSWVGDNRECIVSSSTSTTGLAVGTITATGTTYLNKPSPIGYQQEVPEVGTPPAAQFAFENNVLDSSGNAHHGQATSITYAAGKTGQAAVFDGANSVIKLDPRLGDSTDFTFGAWVYWTGSSAWQRIFDLGDGSLNYMFLTPKSGSNTLRFAIKVGGGAEQTLNSTPLTANTWTHVAVTISGNTGKLFVNGTLVSTNTSMTYHPIDIGTRTNFLGKSRFLADPMFAGRLDDVRFLPNALTDAQVSAMRTNAAPQFSGSSFVKSGGTTLQAYSATLAGDATDADGTALTYSKVAGADWITVAPNGQLGGTPGLAESGAGSCVVQVTDASGAMAYATVTFQVAAPSSGTWTGNADGSWSDATKWSGSAIAFGGGTADFSTLNISPSRTVTLDSPRTVGTLKFGDTSGTDNWTVNASGANALTLDTGATTSPSVVVNQNTATLAAPVSGTNGFTKTGAGRLVLAGNNPLAGVLNVNVGNVSLANPAAAGNVTTIQIPTGTSTLELDGSAGNITLPASFAVNCRANDTPTIQNVSGINTLSGAISLNTGGDRFNLRSDAGLLILSGANQYIGTLTSARSYAFSGAGDHLVSGPILNPTVGSVINLTKTDAGTLTLAGNNTYVGATTLNGGTLVLNGALASGGTLVTAAGTVLMGNGPVNASATINGTHNPGAGIGTQTFGTLAYGSTGRLAWELGRNSVTAGTFDQVAASGAVTVAGGAAVDIVLSPSGSNVAMTDPFWTQPHSWTILTGSSVSGAFALGNVGSDPAGRSAANYGAFALQQSANAVTLTFTPYPPIQVWKRVNFGSDWNNPAIGGGMVDADKDGVANNLEWALGMSPMKNDAVSWTPGNPGLPIQSWMSIGGVEYLSLQVRRPIGLPSTAYSAEVGDLKDWTPAVQEGTPVANGDGSETVIFRDTVPRSVGGARFIRLNITITGE